MNKIWNLLSGKKTYLLAFAAGVYSLGIDNQLWQHYPLLDTILGTGIVASLRNAIPNKNTP